MRKKELIRLLRTEKFPERILNAFEKVNREDFIPDSYKQKAYENRALPIGDGQTISQPYTIAFMLMLLELGEKQKILEVGSGSGYVLALLSEVSKNSKIYGIERIKELANKSREVLKSKNVEVIFGDGSKGLKGEAPFDRILVSAAAEELPQKLVAQLKEGGILVSPVRNSIVVVQKFRNENKVREFPGFVFVPLVED